MLWLVVVREVGLPLELAKLIDGYASMVQVVSCAVPNCPRVGVSANHRCRQHSLSAAKFVYFLFPCENPFVCEGLTSAHRDLANRHYFAGKKIQKMNDFLLTNYNARVAEAKKDKIAERKNIAEAIGLIEAWERSPGHMFFAEAIFQIVAILSNGAIF